MNMPNRFSDFVKLTKGQPEPERPKRQPKPEPKAVLVNEATVTFEWQTGRLTADQIEAIRCTIGRGKAKPDHWQTLATLLDAGQSAAQIAKAKRKQKGFSLAEIKKFQAALNKVRQKV